MRRVESPGQDEAARRLVAILRLAYSGELAAAFAYRGHWRSLPDDEKRGDERRQIQKIEEEELHHRRQLREMLRAMGCAPRRWREARAWLIGRVLGALCHVTGWLLPMYGAGKLESRNVREYEAAARHAFGCGRRLPLWPAPPPKGSIRLTFERDVGSIAAAPSRADGGRTSRPEPAATPR
jgi:hypothetical protein